MHRSKTDQQARNRHWSPSSWYGDVTAGTETRVGSVPWHVAARGAQVEEVHVTEKRTELEVCATLRVPEGSSQGSSEGFE
jgi:hypothetical protein